MRRLPHVLLNTATVASLALCLATVAMWVRSYSVSDRWFWQSMQDENDRLYWTQYLVATGRGRIGMNYVFQGFEPKFKPGILRRASQRGDHQFHWTHPPEEVNFRLGVGDNPHWSGFQHGAFVHPDTPGHAKPRRAAWHWAAPYWAAIPPLIALPAARAWHALRRRLRRARPGHCPACNYDLRATPTRCPECGHTPPHPEPH